MEPKDEILEDEVTTLELANEDAAVILRADGGIESFLPENDDEYIEPGSPTMVAAVLMYILSDDNRYRALENEFLDMCGKLPDSDQGPGMLH